jgi:hypothetical protein
MRLLLDHQKRVLPNLEADQPSLLRAHIELLAEDSILLGMGSFADFESNLRLLPASTSREILKEKIIQGTICYFDQNEKTRLLETNILPEGTFQDLVESGAWHKAREQTRSATRSKEPNGEAFSRLLGDIFSVSKGITIVDKFLTWDLLERAVGENSSPLFWFEKLLTSSAVNLHLYFGDITTRHLQSSRGFSSSSRAYGLSEEKRLAFLMEFLSNQLETSGFRGTLDVWLSRKMPHDRQVRIALEGKRNGILYFGFSKGIDMFESDPINASYSIYNKTKMDWLELMNQKSGEWPQSSSSNPWTLVSKKETNQHSVSAWLRQEK